MCLNSFTLSFVSPCLYKHAPCGFLVNIRQTPSNKRSREKLFTGFRKINCCGSRQCARVRPRGSVCDPRVIPAWLISRERRFSYICVGRCTATGRSDKCVRRHTLTIKPTKRHLIFENLHSELYDRPIHVYKL